MPPRVRCAYRFPVLVDDAITIGKDEDANAAAIEAALEGLVG